MQAVCSFVKTKEQHEQIAHGCSFVKSNVSESLTVLFKISDFERKSEEQKSEFPTLICNALIHIRIIYHRLCNVLLMWECNARMYILYQTMQCTANVGMQCSYILYKTMQYAMYC